jgi:hypothetical protein
MITVVLAIIMLKLENFGKLVNIYLLKFLLWKKKKSLIYLADYNLFIYWKSRSTAACLSRSWYCKEPALKINASDWIQCFRKHGWSYIF